MGNFIYYLPGSTPNEPDFLIQIENANSNSDIDNLYYHKALFETYLDNIIENLYNRKKIDLVKYVISLNSSYDKGIINLAMKYIFDYKFEYSNQIIEEMSIYIDYKTIIGYIDKINIYHLAYLLKKLSVIEIDKLLEYIITNEKNNDLAEYIIVNYLCNSDLSELIVNCIICDNIGVLKILIKKNLSIDYDNIFKLSCKYDSLKCIKYLFYEGNIKKLYKDDVCFLIDNNSIKITEWAIKLYKNIFTVEVFEYACDKKSYNFAKLIYDNVKIPIEIINKYENYEN